MQIREQTGSNQHRYSFLLQFGKIEFVRVLNGAAGGSIWRLNLN